jgi:hypothetical protein
MDEHTPEEPEEVTGERTPEHGTTSLINANVAIPVNAEVAANVLSNTAPAAPEDSTGEPA